MGKTLVRRAEDRLRESGFKEYLVKTAADPENPALRFYDELGFTRSHRAVSLGQSFQVYTKML